MTSMPAWLSASIRSRFSDASAANSRRKEYSATPASGFWSYTSASEPRHDDGFVQRLFGGEVAIQRADAHAGPFGDQVNGHRDALRGKDLFGRLEDLFVIPHGVNPHWFGRLRLGLRCHFGAHDPT